MFQSSTGLSKAFVTFEIFVWANKANQLSFMKQGLF